MLLEDCWFLENNILFHKCKCNMFKYEMRKNLNSVILNNAWFGEFHRCAKWAYRWLNRIKETCFVIARAWEIISFLYLICSMFSTLIVALHLIRESKMSKDEVSWKNQQKTSCSFSYFIKNFYCLNILRCCMTIKTNQWIMCVIGNKNSIVFVLIEYFYLFFNTT